MLLVLAIAAAALAAAALGGAEPKGIPARARKYLPLFRKWAQLREIPLDILLTWAKLESDFRPTLYNPERGRMKAWACAVASDPEKWAGNPHFERASRLCRELEAGTLTPAAVIALDQGKPFDERLWTFGSTGMVQVSRITAAEVGYAPHLPNSGLLDVDTNLRLASAYIARLRARLFPGETHLTDAEWSEVRAVYVMGVAGSRRNPVSAQKKRVKFLRALTDIRGGVPVA